MAHAYSERTLVAYVLGQLPAEQRQQLEHHLAICDNCRLAVSRERTLARAIRKTLSAATQPSPGRLAELRPALAPTARHTRSMRPALALVLLVVLALGSLQLQPGRAGSPPPTALSATATHVPSLATTSPYATTLPVEARPTAATPVAVLVPVLHHN